MGDVLRICVCVSHGVLCAFEFESVLSRDLRPVRKKAEREQRAENGTGLPNVLMQVCHEGERGKRESAQKETLYQRICLFQHQEFHILHLDTNCAA